VKSGKSQLSLALEIKADTERKGTLPLLLTRDGAKSQIDLALGAAIQRQNLKFDLAKNRIRLGQSRIAGR